MHINLKCGIQQSFNRRVYSQLGFTRAVYYPYLLTALAFLVALYFWVSGKDKIALLEKSNSEEVTRLQSEIQKNKNAQGKLQNNVAELVAENDSLNERLPAIKLKASYANAKSQRAQYVLDTNHRLAKKIDTLTESNRILTDTNNTLTEALPNLPELKMELSHARAKNHRALHVVAARDNLMKSLQKSQEENIEILSLIHI